MQIPLNGVTPLPHLGVIRAQGPDAATFLHGQLTQDFALLGPSEARLAAFCTAKGRIQASFIGFKRSPEEILLVCSRDLLAPVLKRLSMFVLRAKARLSDASDDFQLLGITGGALDALAPASTTPWSRQELGDASLVQLYPADGQARALWVAPNGTEPPAAPPLSLESWMLGEVRAGVATVGAAVVEAFVPQMLNYESVGGVNFKKGCYPGQEVVARSQFRGVLKRRAMLAHCSAEMVAGQDIFTPDDAEQPCATVVQAAACPEGGWDAIVSGQVAAMQQAATLHLGSAQGPALQVRAMPYPLLEDV
ncbi:folate-binding protein [Comamonadaceae bacterium G21597-S1]|nr:folate-binding protein [Comamonadaceae bacterium G21597-S1]